MWSPRFPRVEPDQASVQSSQHPFDQWGPSAIEGLNRELRASAARQVAFEQRLAEMYGSMQGLENLSVCFTRVSRLEALHLDERISSLETGQKLLAASTRRALKGAVDAQRAAQCGADRSATSSQQHQEEAEWAACLDGIRGSPQPESSDCPSVAKSGTTIGDAITESGTFANGFNDRFAAVVAAFSGENAASKSSIEGDSCSLPGAGPQVVKYDGKDPVGVAASGSIPIGHASPRSHTALPLPDEKEEENRSFSASYRQDQKSILEAGQAELERIQWATRLEEQEKRLSRLTRAVETLSEHALADRSDRTTSAPGVTFAPESKLESERKCDAGCAGEEINRRCDGLQEVIDSKVMVPLGELSRQIPEILKRMHQLASQCQTHFCSSRAQEVKLETQSRQLAALLGRADFQTKS